MRKIENLATIEGRKLLRDIYKELRYDKQRNAIIVLFAFLRICTQETDLSKYVKQEIYIIHKLGLYRGFILWMEEIVNRFYFSSINSFVYFGAAVLLVLIGVRRFNDNVSNNVVIFGIVFEAIMLLFMFFVMLFTPDEISESSEENESDATEEIITEIGEIGRDFAAAVVRLESIGENIKLMINRQEELINSMAKIAESTQNAVAPNPQMIEIMKTTNTSLGEFNNGIEKLNTLINDMKQEEVQTIVRKELESIIVKNIKEK